MKRYKQKLRDVWLQMPEFRPWLRRDPEDSYRARCRFCKCGVNTKICDLRAHALTKKHMKRNSAFEIKRNDSSIDEDDASGDNDVEYKPKSATAKRSKSGAADSKNMNSIRKTSPIKTELRSSNGPDYEAIIESLALYEPEQALFMNDSTTHSDGQLEQPPIDEEMITNAVTVAVKNMKDSAQIFGDFVADRLRQLNDETAEFAKDKIMQIILEATAVNRSNISTETD